MRILVCYILFMFSSSIIAQDAQLWKGYFSYNEITDVTIGNNKVLAATENAVFGKNENTGDLKILNSIIGFKPESITAIYYSQAFDIIFAGNTNGLLVAVKNTGEVIYKVDIIEEVPVAPSIKRINNLYENNGRLYISCDYGISVLNLENLEFISTYFIGTSGESDTVFQCTVNDGKLYAATRNNGIRFVELSNPFIYDYNQWQTLDSGFWNGIVTFNNTLVAMNFNSRTYRYNGSTFIEILNHFQPGLKLKTNNTQVILTTLNNVYVIDEFFSLSNQFTTISGNTYSFQSATVLDDFVYIGTKDSGLFKISLTNPSNVQNLSPDGPFRNYIFRAKKTPNKLWVVYGDHNRFYNPYALDELPISNFSNNSGWTSIPYSNLLGAKSICDLTFNPSNPNEIYASSYFSGLLKINGEDISLFNNTNTGPNGLETLVDPTLPSTYVDIRINGPKFDKDGNLWVTNNFVNKTIKTLRANGTWQSYDISASVAGATSGSYGSQVIDKNGTKWIPSLNSGVIGFNEKFGNKFILINTETGNLPDGDVRCVAVDNKNQLWIGTFRGLRVLNNVDSFISQTELTTTNIIIQEGDLAQELFFEQTILDIAVDGANRKWVSIAGGGVFLVSPNGKQIIYKFNKRTAPLPSDNVVDIEIDGETGEVFFATDKGMVSFLGTATKPSDDLSNIFAYPNPVRPGFTGTVKISALTDKATIKITDIEGNLVYETTSEGGTIEWDTSAFGKYKVATGVYMLFVSTKDGLETTVKKLLIVR